MNHPELPSEVLEALRHLDACSVANAIEECGVRLLNEGFADHSIRCLFPDLPPMVGYAATVKIRGANPPIGRHTYVDRTDWWDYVRTVPEPRVLVVQDDSSQPGLGALLGEVHVNILRALGCAGAVTNGSVRDLPAVRDLGFQMFAGGPTVSHVYLHIVEVAAPVLVGGLTVQSGDLLHGDRHGVQLVPLAAASRIPEVAARQRALDHAVIALCRSSDFTLTKLRALVSQPHS